MNQWDRDNLNFLINADRDTMEDWYQHATPDDYKYALELLAAAKSELMIQEQELMEQDLDVSDAAKLLKKFQL
jgi:hypothetical protein